MPVLSIFGIIKRKQKVCERMITLRKITPADQEQFLDMLTSNLVNKTYMLPDFAARTDAIALFERLMTLSDDESRFVRCISCDGTAVGFLNDVEKKDGKVEIGYVIHPEHHNKGYMTQALKAAISQLFRLGFQEVVCGAFEGNDASMRVMAKSGMVLIPYSDTVDYRGQTHKCIYYAIKKEETEC